MRTPTFVAAVLAAVVLSTSGCGGGQVGAGSADDAARLWMSQTDDLLRSGKGPIGKLPGWKGPRPGQLDAQLGGAPPLSPELSPTVRAALERSTQRARNLRDFYVYVDDLANRVRAADDAVPAMVDDAMLFDLPPQARQVLEQAGQEIGKSAVCGLAWDLMTLDEQAVAQQTGNGLDPAFARLVGMGRDALEGAISGFLRTSALKAFIDPGVVDWTLYAQDVYGKAAEITADGRETLVVSDVTVSRAMVQYARICLAPPS